MINDPYKPAVFAFATPDLSGDPDVFPRLPGRAWGVVKTPTWNTVVKATASGREVRTQLMMAPVYKFSVQHEFLRDNDVRSLAERKLIVDFFNGRAGRPLELPGTKFRP